MGILNALEKILTDIGFQVDLTSFLVLFGLAVSRLLTAIALAPFVGGSSVPPRVKVGLAAIVAAVLFPSISAQTRLDQVTALVFVGLLVKEAMIGATIGFLSQVVFYAVQVAGVLIDTQRGMNQAIYYSLQLPGNVSILGQLKFQAALALFLTLDGHLLFMRALHSSFVDLPLTDFPRFSQGVVPLFEQMARITGDLLLVALQLSTPVLLALFLVDVAFACLGKVSPQINVHSESQPVKAMLGLAILLLALTLIIDRLQGVFSGMIESLYKAYGLIA